MKILVLDFETMFDSKTYTLSKQTTEHYCRDPRFEAHGCAIKWIIDNKEQSTYWLNEPEFRAFAKTVDWSEVFFIAHHCAFDGLILSHHYKALPRAMCCTMSMSRLLHGTHVSHSLENLRKRMGMPGKSTPYNRFDGKRWHELDSFTQRQIADGAIDEVESIWKIWKELAKTFPLEEFNVLDTTIQMFTNPVLIGDREQLAAIWQQEHNKKQTMLRNLGVTEEELQSADRFIELLEAAGVEIEFKAGKNGPIPAFAKTDPFMRWLMEHEDEEVAALAAARLGVKSTFMQTRAETLGFMNNRGPLCVYLNYCGAGTLRPSGGDKANWLNFKRNTSLKPGELSLRKAIKAPPGFKLAPVDSAQVECRVGHFLAGGPDEPVVRKFRNKEDPYVDLATLFYQERVYKPQKGDPRQQEMEARRGVGKQGRLMCMYGCSGKQFKQTAKNGLYGPPVEMAIEKANEFVGLYRQSNPSICARHDGYWAQCERMIARLAGGPPVDWGPLHVRDHRIYLPNGAYMVYDTMEFYRPTVEEAAKLREFERDGFWRMRTRQGWKKMWGSKLMQNCCEAVSRVIVSQAMTRIVAKGYRILNWPYDELLCLVPEENAEWHAEQCRLEMIKPVDWLPGLPLDAEVITSVTYDK